METNSLWPCRPLQGSACMCLTAFLAVLLWFLSPGVFAQDQKESKIVKDILLSTRYKYPSADTFRPLIPLESGQEIIPEKLHGLEAMLTQSGLFRSVKVETHEDPAGLSILFHLWQVERVRRIRLKGNFWVLDSAVYRVLEMQEGDRFDPEKLEEEENKIKRLYRRKGWFGTKVTSSYKQDPEDGSVCLTYEIRSGRHVRFRDIELEGVQKGNEEEIRDKLRIWPWLSERRLNKRLEKIRRLYKDLGYPEAKVRVVKEDYEGDQGPARLEVSVQEGKKLVVDVQGNRNLSAKRIRKEMTFFKEGGYGFFEAEDSARAIQKLYENKGFPLAHVTFRRKEGEGEVRILFTIEEGPRAFIQDVVLEGNREIAVRQIRKQMLTRPRNLFLLRRGRYLSDRWDKDLEAVQNLFLADGYLDVEIHPKVEHVENREHRILLNVRIEQGPRYTVDASRWAGVSKEWEPAVKKKSFLREGAPFNPARQADEATRVARLFAQKGYLLARVDTDYQFMPDHGVEMFFKVHKGPCFKATGVVVAGNEHTRTHTIRKAVRISKGDPIDSRRLARARDRLFRLRIFENMSLDVLGLNLPENMDQEDQPREVIRPILIKVKEQKALDAEIGARYNSDTGMEGFVTLNHSNLFGRAQRVGIDALYGEKKWEASFAWTDPTLLGYRLTGTVQGKQVREFFEAFTKEDTSVTGTLSRTFRRIYTPSVSVSFERSTVFDVVSQAPDAPEPVTTENIFFGPLFQLDSRDDKIYPSRGVYAQTGGAVCGRTWGSTDDLVVSRFRLSGYVPLSPKWILAATVSMDSVEPFGRTRKVPATELLFAGGNTTVRGFPLERLGPLDADGNPLGGTTRILGSLEIRFPLYRLVHGFAFVDTGSLTEGWKPVTFDTFRWTSGGGLRLYTPVGPVCLGYGHQLQSNPPLDRGRIIFSLGFPY